MTMKILNYREEEYVTAPEGICIVSREKLEDMDCCPERRFDIEGELCCPDECACFEEPEEY